MDLSGVQAQQVQPTDNNSSIQINIFLLFLEVEKPSSKLVLQCRGSELDADLNSMLSLNYCEALSHLSQVAKTFQSLFKETQDLLLTQVDYLIRYKTNRYINVICSFSFVLCYIYFSLQIFFTSKTAHILVEIIIDYYKLCKYGDIAKSIKPVVHFGSIR